MAKKQNILTKEVSSVFAFTVIVALSVVVGVGSFFFEVIFPIPV